MLTDRTSEETLGHPRGGPGCRPRASRSTDREPRRGCCRPGVRGPPRRSCGLTRRPGARRVPTVERSRRPVPRCGPPGESRVGDRSRGTHRRRRGVRADLGNHVDPHATSTESLSGRHTPEPRHFRARSRVVPQWRPRVTSAKPRVVSVPRAISSVRTVASLRVRSASPSASPGQPTTASAVGGDPLIGPGQLPLF